MGTGFRLGAEGRRGGANTVPWKTMLALDLSGPEGTKSAEKCLQRIHRKFKVRIKCFTNEKPCIQHYDSNSILSRLTQTPTPLAIFLGF